MNKRARELLEAADPARGIQLGAGDVEEVLRLASNDVTSYDAVVPAQRARRLVAVGAAFAVVAVAAMTVTVLRSTAGPVESSRPSAVPGAAGVPAHCLATIANRMRATSYDGQTGRYEYLHRRGRGGSSALHGDPAWSATVQFSEETSRWLAANGSGRMRIVRGAPTYPDEASRDFYNRHPGMIPKEGSETDDLRPGDLSVLPLPAAEPAAMGQALYQPRENGPSQVLVSVAELNNERVVGFAHRVAVLRFLAGTEGVTCRDEQTDPAGRTGVVVSADFGRGPRPSPGDWGREYLLFDPQTGELLARGGGANSAAGGVTWSTVYLERGYTDVLG
ncbi:CU044_5270 family protein [Micromonospora sp. U21]|uniref:CU044_5270 family protein n=1 Tax=Micromonospora sp. U21 TaxID=2824899 RepID=UPI001B36ACE1|nr:CU044_5270 family protein [Micromonospora sp. U21]MBQ0903420.1 CU044_5270 family protein [Micromonospora sp. U21]